MVRESCQKAREAASSKSQRGWLVDLFLGSCCCEVLLYVHPTVCDSCQGLGFLAFEERNSLDTLICLKKNKKYGIPKHEEQFCLF
jgi:hypothetical protein